MKLDKLDTKRMKGYGVRRRRKGELQFEILRLLYRAEPRGVRELQKLTGHTSPSPIQYALKVLEKKEHILKYDKRSYIITPSGIDLLGLSDKENHIRCQLKKVWLNDLAKMVENAQNVEDIKKVFLDEKKGLIVFLKKIFE